MSAADPCRCRFPAALLLVVLAAATCGGAQTSAGQSGVTPALAGDPAHPGETRGWVETQLFFGLGPADGRRGGVSEQAWREFLDREVTPRFPAGLSVMDVYGQWLDRSGTVPHGPSRIRSKMLLIAYPETAENAAKVDAIRSAWKARTGDRSVLKITKPADVSF